MLVLSSKPADPIRVVLTIHASGHPGAHVSFHDLRDGHLTDLGAVHPDHMRASWPLFRPWTDRDFFFSLHTPCRARPAAHAKIKEPLRPAGPRSPVATAFFNLPTALPVPLRPGRLHLKNHVSTPKFVPYPITIRHPLDPILPCRYPRRQTETAFGVSIDYHSDRSGTGTGSLRAI